MIRRDIGTDDTAREQFIEGVHRLKARPWPGQPGLGMYDFFVFWHHRAMMLETPAGAPMRNAAHAGPVFLPWHRYLLLRFESLLRRELGDDGFRLPYWNWMRDAQLAQPERASLWGPETLGGSGRPVGSGPFQRRSPDGPQPPAREPRARATARRRRGQPPRARRGPPDRAQPGHV